MRNTVLAILICLTAAPLARADKIVLRDGHIAPGATRITLAAIADLHGPAAEKLADLTISTVAPDQPTHQLTLLSVRNTLSEHEVHWGKLSLAGQQELTVSRRGISTDTPRTRETRTTTETFHETDALRANPVDPFDVDDHVLTLRQAVDNLIRRTHPDLGNDLRITHQRPEDPVWLITDTAARFELEPMDNDLLGRVPFVIRRWSGDHLIGSERVTVEVAIRRDVVVARKTVSRGQVITATDVAVESRWMTEHLVDTTLRGVEDVIGQTADRTLRPGAIIDSKAVRPPNVVRRGQLVTVRVISGGLVIKTVARAQEDGYEGQVIEVRNDHTRQRFHARVVGPQMVVLQIGQQVAQTPGGTP